MGKLGFRVEGSCGSAVLDDRTQVYGPVPIQKERFGIVDVHGRFSVDDALAGVAMVH